MSWFVVDDQAFQHPKHTMLVRRGLAGEADALAAGYLWVLMGSRLKAALKDGVLDRFDLFGVVPDPRVLRWAQILVEVGLWHDSDHCCERCEPPPRGSWCFHDWRRYYKRTGAQERLERAMQDERKDPALKTAVWERDRLPGTDPDGPDEALCVYCRRRVSRTTRGGDLAPEIDHVWARPMGVDGLAVSCRHCNRQKGRRSAEEAGLTFHPTAAHAAALARRRETFSHPQGSAEMLHGAGPGERPWNQPAHSRPSHRYECQSPPRPAAGGASLDPEDGAERRFAHGRNRLLSEKVKRLRQTDRCHGLPFSGRSRVDSRHQDEFTVFMLLQPFNGGKGNFCFVLAVKLQIVFRQTHLRGNLRNRL